MPEKPLITISLPPGMRFPGAEVAGVMDLNVKLAEEKSIEQVKLSLRGILTTWITVSNGNSSSKHTMQRPIFPDQTTVIWRPGMPLPSHTSGVASLPFAFTIPIGHWPTSFQGGSSRDGGSIQYLIHAEGVRKQWYKFNIRVNAVFPLLAFDTSLAPTYPLPDWPYGWDTLTKMENVRKGLFSHSGQVTAELIWPKMESIPLFRQIPIRVHVVCRSKPLPLSAANDPSTFEFPRNPKLADIDLNLYLHSFIKSSKTFSKRNVRNDLGLQAGFGLPDKVTDRAVWGKEVVSSVGPPSWHVDLMNSEKGYWQEEITHASVIIFRCSPPVVTEYLSTKLCLNLIVGFPGVGNNVKMEVGSLNLTTGVSPSTFQTPSALDGPGVAGEAAPAYEPPGAQYNLELPPSYYTVVHVDDGKKSEKS